MAVVRVGVGCFVRNSLNRSLVLVGKRKESHGIVMCSQIFLTKLIGAGTLALPGGHLEMGETWEECSIREILEETNLLIKDVKFVGATNDIAIGGNIAKHYVTIFMAADVDENSQSLQNLEPEKCEGWNWISFNDLKNMSREDPLVLFDPLRHFLERYDSLPS